jgi:hypothetical protein
MKEKDKKDSSSSESEEEMKDEREYNLENEIKTSSQVPESDRVKLRTSIFQCLAAVCDKSEAAREKVFQETNLLDEIFASISCQHDDKKLVYQDTLASCRFLTALGRSDKAKKAVVQEHGGFAVEMTWLYMSQGVDIDIRTQALKAIANFGVDFKTFLTINGLLD